MSVALPRTDPIRVAVAGLGWVTRSVWLPLLQEHPAFQVTAVVDPDPAARAKVAGTDVAPLASPGELSADAVDLVIVAVPNHLHCAVACELLERGISVFVEKPVCLTSQEAGRLGRAERAGGATLLAGSATRYRADVQALRQAQRSLGPIRHVELGWVRARGVPDGGGWFTRRQLAGGGALVDLGWHLLDLAGLLLGPLAIRHVGGVTSADFLRRGSSGATWRGDGPATAVYRAPDVEDTAYGFLIDEAGVAISLRASWASHEAVDVSRITVHGAAGSATLRCTFGFSPNRLPRPELTITRDGRTEPVPLPEDPVGAEYRRQVDALPGLLAGPDARGRAVDDATRVIGIVERIYECAAAFPSPIEELPGGVKAVVFDLDGVLVDSFQVMREAFAIAYAEVVGSDEPPFEEYAQHLGRYFPDIMRIMGLPPEMEGPFVRESNRLADRVRVYEGVPELLRVLRDRGLRLAVATGKSGVRARHLLGLLGLLPLFDHVIGSDEVARAKPAPDIVRRALTLLEVEPGAAVMVGDAPTDIQSARAASVTALAAAWGECDLAQLIEAGPDAVLYRPGDLLSHCSTVEQMVAAAE